MPFGLKMSQDFFQEKINQTLQGCSGTVGIADDVIIYGKSEEEHDKHTHEMMDRCTSTGLKLNPDKCTIKQKKIKFHSVICSPDGIQPDPDKVSALKKMTPPTSKQELQAFLGLATYMGPFIPSLSTLTLPLRELVKDRSVFDWSPAHQDAFDKVKNAISAKTTLEYYDPTKEIILQADASSTGLGATLLQDQKPIAFASKTLTDTKSRYANIERELFAVVYRCEHFHTYLLAVLWQNQTTSPWSLYRWKNLVSAPQGYKECCSDYNHMTSPSDTTQANKCMWPMPLQGSPLMKLCPYQIWMFKYMKYAHNFQMNTCRKYKKQHVKTPN